VLCLNDEAEEEDTKKEREVYCRDYYGVDFLKMK